MKQNFKRIFSIFCVLVMLLSLMTTTFYATEDTAESTEGTEPSQPEATEPEITEPQVFTFLADDFYLAYDPDTVVEDETSLYGKAAQFSLASRRESGDKGLINSMIRTAGWSIGINTYTTESVLVGRISYAQMEENAAAGEYKTYTFQNVPLITGEGNTILYMFDCWGLKVNFSKDTQDALRGKYVDVTVSMKITGDITAVESDPTYFVDMIEIKVTDYEPEQQPADGTLIFKADQITRPYNAAYGCDTVVDDITSKYGRAVKISYEDRMPMNDAGLLNSLIRNDGMTVSLRTNDERPMGYITPEELMQNVGQYAVYSFPSVELIKSEEDTFLYMFDCWGVQVRFTKEQQDAMRGQVVDIQVSMKVEGDVTDRNNPPTYYIDEIIVKPGDPNAAHKHIVDQWTVTAENHSGVCGSCKQEIIGVHVWDEGVATGNTGEKVQSCKVCGHVKGAKTSADSVLEKGTSNYVDVPLLGNQDILYIVAIVLLVAAAAVTVVAVIVGKKRVPAEECAEENEIPAETTSPEEEVTLEEKTEE